MGCQGNWPASVEEIGYAGQVWIRPHLTVGNFGCDGLSLFVGQPQTERDAAHTFNQYVRISIHCCNRLFLISAQMITEIGDVTSSDSPDDKWFVIFGKK